MAVTINDILRIKMCGELFNQQICNIFFYIVKVWTGVLDLDDVLDIFDSDVVNKFTQYASDEMVWTELILDDVTNDLDFAVSVINAPGILTTTPALPSYVAASVVLKRNTKITREGGKRIPGLIEGQVTDNSLNVNTVRDDVWIDACTLSLRDDTPAVNLRADPVIVGRLPSGALDLTKINNITGAEVHQLVSTQNTRKQKLG